MGFFSVLNNTSSLIALQESTASGVGLQNTLAKLSSGKRLFRSAEDPAGLAIADGLRGQIRTLQQAVRNANDAQGFLQTGDSALSSVQNILTRAASLAAQAASDTNSGQYDAIENELEQLFSEIDRIGGGTEFNGIQIFVDTTREIFVGDTQNATGNNATISFSTSGLSVSGLGFTGTGAQVSVATGGAVTVSIGSGGDAQALLEDIESAIDLVAEKRGNFGSQLNRLDNALSVISSQIQNLTAAESQIRDANLAEEITNLTKFQILTQSGIASLAQANQSQQSVLSLF
ncbi:MAG TPA: flagellin [Acidobacteriota bacterium]|nr:flagellin [Acidobacteriota bacterium]